MNTISTDRLRILADKAAELWRNDPYVLHVEVLNWIEGDDGPLATPDGNEVTLLKSIVFDVKDVRMHDRIMSCAMYYGRQRVQIYTWVRRLDGR